MPRPRLAPGTNGRISTWQVGPSLYVARTWYREWSGRRRQIERRGTSENKAIQALKTAVRDKLKEGTGEDATPDTTLTQLTDLFLERKRAEGRSIRTMVAYEQACKTITGVDGIGELTVREATAGRVGKFLRNIHDQRGPGAAKTVRSVLSGLFTIAVSEDALDVNPVRQLGREDRPAPSGAKAIPLDEVPRLRAAIAADKDLSDEDIADAFLLQLATGLRIGEALALRWVDVDLDAGTLTVTGTMTRQPGHGVVRQDRPKTHSSRRTIAVPQAGLDVLKGREQDDELVFPDRLGHPRDPNRVELLLRRRRDALGYPTLTTHSFRKTCATALDQAGLSARAIADYLGHSQPSTTQNKYMARGLDTTAAAEAMQAALESDE